MDYFTEQKKLVSIVMIGMGSVQKSSPGEMEIWEEIVQGISPLSVSQASIVQTMRDHAIRAFHSLPSAPYVQVSYLSPTFICGTKLLPSVAQHVLQQLARPFLKPYGLINVTNARLER